MFPKIKKSLQNFLTDESGNITKRDAFWISAIGMLVMWAEDVAAWHTNNSFPTSTSPVGADPFPSNASIPANSSRTNTWTIVNSATCNHASGVVNGHYSSVPTVDIASQKIDYTKSHSNHGSHSSGGWC